jgi:hypothetical protein
VQNGVIVSPEASLAVFKALRFSRVPCSLSLQDLAAILKKMNF